MLEYKVTLFASLSEGEITFSCYVEAESEEKAIELANERFDDAVMGGSGWSFDVQAVKRSEG